MMQTMRLGRTNMQASRSGFGALPIQRVSLAEAKHLLRKACDNGINFFDTARAYSDSEEKLGHALADVRRHIVIATKTHAKDKASLLSHLEISLRNLQTDYVDILQLHNPGSLPDPDDPNSLYGGLQEAQKRGLVRFIGITNHKLSLAIAAAKSGLYDTIQFPLSSLSSDQDLELIEVCRQQDVGLIAMKGLCGGLITNAATSFAFLRQFSNVLPIWGIQREWELDQFIAMEAQPPLLDDDMLQLIQADRAALAGEFCRGCGYCLPCPVNIDIPTAARMAFLLRRSPYQPLLEKDWQEKMELITQCRKCGSCSGRCPYGLDTPKLLERMLQDYREFLSQHM